MSRRPIFLALALAGTLALGVAGAGAAEDPAAGLWRTEDGKGLIEIRPCGASLCGRIVWFQPLPGQPPFDTENPKPELRKRPLCGLDIIGGFKHAADGGWEDGWVYDPKSGSTYHAKMYAESADRLRLRGYIGIPLLGETQVWTRIPPTEGPRCKAG